MEVPDVLQLEADFFIANEKNCAARVQEQGWLHGSSDQCWAQPHNFSNLYSLMCGYLPFNLGKMPVFGLNFFN